MAVFAVQAEEYSYTFTAKQFSANGTKTLGEVDWTLEGNGNYWGYDGTKGQQFGSGNAPYKSLTLSTSDIKGTISKIVLNTSGASSISGSVQVTVGGKNFGNKITLTKTATNYTLEGSASGNVVISYTQTSSKAIYIKSITITYTEDAGGDGGDEPETPAAPNDPTLTASTTFKGSMDVEIADIADDAKVYYTTDGTEPSATNGTEYTDSFEITETTTVKAIAVNEGGSSKVVSAVYTLVEDTKGYYIKVVAEPADWSGKYLIVYEEGNDAYVFNGADAVNGYVSAITNGDVISANSEIDAVAVTVAAMDGGYSISTAGGYMYKTAYSNGVDFGTTAMAANTFAISEDGVVIASGKNEDKTIFRFNSAKDQMRFRYYKSGQKPVQLYKYVEEVPMSHTLTVSDAGLATLYLGFNARIPSSVEAYTVTAVNEGWVSLTQVTGVLPASTGVIVKATAGEYKFEATAETASVESLLKGSTVSEVVTPAGTAYVLGVNEGVVGFYRAELDMNDGVAFLNNANKAYLVVPAASQAVQYFSFDFGAGTTGIEGIEAEGAVSGKIYDITGREVKAITTPGIYIVGGKKVVVK